jgi:hypothetical protein
MMTFHHLEKFSFYSHLSSRCCYGCIHHMQHRLFTASVSFGGHFFLLLPLCVLQSIFFLEKKAFFLRFFFRTLVVSPLHVMVSWWLRNKNGILCILYGVGLTCNCMSFAFGSVEADCFQMEAFRFNPLVCSDHFSRTSKDCRRRAMNEWIYLMDFSHGFDLGGKNYEPKGS